ncbi:MAG: hypothetical protein SFW66_05210 [Gammaproteobacteria bacterium]|nr:hypothetical protein [Gammaproteobacteria bacterium]
MFWVSSGIKDINRSFRAFEKALQTFNTQLPLAPMSLEQVIHIAASPQELIIRQEERVAKAKAEGLSQRPDDDVNIYRKRLSDYINKTQSVIEHYKMHNNFLEVDGSRSVEFTHHLLMTAITDQQSNINACNDDSLESKEEQRVFSLKH